MCTIRHFYPRSPCGERLRVTSNVLSQPSISIHALLAESDAETAKTSTGDIKFLSTLSLRRATISSSSAETVITSFLSTLSLRRATNGPMKKGQVYYIISIHALLAESDAGKSQTSRAGISISIHALLAESDPFRDAGNCTTTDFYPRSPCGERLGQLCGVG